MRRSQILIAVGALVMGLGMLDLARDGWMGTIAIAVAAVIIAYATRGTPSNNGPDDAR